MKNQGLSGLLASGAAIPVAGANKVQLLVMLADGFNGKGENPFYFNPIYKPIRHIEDTELQRLRIISTIGTALEPMVDALNARGHETEQTVGSFMDTVGLDQEDMHQLVCHCHGKIANGDAMAKRLRNLAAGIPNIDH